MSIQKQMHPIQNNVRVQSARFTPDEPHAVGPPEYGDHQKTHCNCIVCGSDNPISLGMKFDMDVDGSAHANFTGSALFQGYTGILHGGIVATLLDATMTHCLFYNGIRAVTGDLHIRYLKPVPYQRELRLSASIVSSYSILYNLRAQLHCKDVLLAKGDAKFMTV